MRSFGVNKYIAASAAAVIVVGIWLLKWSVPVTFDGSSPLSGAGGARHLMRSFSPTRPLRQTAAGLQNSYYDQESLSLLEASFNDLNLRRSEVALLHTNAWLDPLRVALRNDPVNPIKVRDILRGIEAAHSTIGSLDRAALIRQLESIDQVSLESVLEGAQARYALDPIVSWRSALYEERQNQLMIERNDHDIAVRQQRQQRFRVLVFFGGLLILGVIAFVLALLFG